MPTPKARPPREIMFRVILRKYIRAKVTTIEIGMEMPITMVVPRLRRKSQRMMMARSAPMMALLLTECRFCSMNSAWSKTVM